MQFGIPNQRKTREEKYPNTPIMTLGIEGAKGTARTMVFNPKACEKLGLEDDKAIVAFSFDNGIYVLNGNQQGVPSEHTIKVTKNYPRRISDKKTYEYMSKVLGLDNSIENEFELKSIDAIAGQPTIFKLVVYTDVLQTKSDTMDDTNTDSTFSMESEVTQQA